MPLTARPAPVAYQPKPQARPSSTPQPKPLPKTDSTMASGEREAPVGYRYRIHVPPPDEIGIVLPE
ncbi:MAG: hypothetical protein U0798_01560 [Gemmataceae bacterium]